VEYEWTSHKFILPLCHLCAKKFYRWWKSVKVPTKIILHSFFETRWPYRVHATKRYNKLTGRNRTEAFGIVERKALCIPRHNNNNNNNLICIAPACLMTSEALRRISRSFQVLSRSAVFIAYGFVTIVSRLHSAFCRVLPRSVTILTANWG